MRTIDADKLNRKLKRYMKQAEKGDISKLIPELPDAGELMTQMVRVTLKKVIAKIDNEPTVIRPEPRFENDILLDYNTKTGEVRKRKEKLRGDKI